MVKSAVMPRRCCSTGGSIRIGVIWRMPKRGEVGERYVDSPYPVLRLAVRAYYNVVNPSRDHGAVVRVV